ncbi:MAG: RNA polymerase sigma factor, partial [Actinomycetota bacterium]
LVLREFEGRSHEEIASAMGVSPDQAKALIHRAKKSFRRAWDGEVERRGIAALAPILLAPFKLPGFLRRLAQPAHDAVANVAATAQQAAVQVTASPAVAQGSVSIADKVTAAALTVIVAGTVSVGAVAIRHRDQTPKPPVASTAPAPAPLVVVAAPLVGAEGRVAPKQQHRRHHHAAPATQGGEQASPSAVPSATPAGSDPSGSPSPSPESPAPPPPAPAWSGSFEGVGGLSADHLVQVSQSVTGRPSGQMLFGETMSGPVAGPQHQHLGDVYADFSGWLSGGRGALSSVWLWIDAPEGQYRYAADGILSSAVQGSDGSTTYVFSGEYHLSGIPDLPGAEVPHDGTLAISVTFWGDGTLYGADVSLS